MGVGNFEGEALFKTKFETIKPKTMRNPIKASFTAIRKTMEIANIAMIMTEFHSVRSRTFFNKFEEGMSSVYQVLQSKNQSHLLLG